MSWNEATIMDQRIRFVVSAVQQTASMTRLCEEFGITRPTGYLWLGRYRRGGFAALVDASHRPYTSPARTPATLEGRVLELRQQYGWGGKKLVYLLSPNEQLSVPTINRILKRRGQVPPADRHAPGHHALRAGAAQSALADGLQGPLSAAPGLVLPFVSAG